MNISERTRMNTGHFAHIGSANATRNRKIYLYERDKKKSEHSPTVTTDLNAQKSLERLSLREKKVQWNTAGRVALEMHLSIVYVSVHADIKIYLCH